MVSRALFQLVEVAFDAMKTFLGVALVASVVARVPPMPLASQGSDLKFTARVDGTLMQTKIAWDGNTL